MRAWKEDLNFHDLILNDPEIAGRVARTKIEQAFDLKRQLKNIDKIFVRVFPKKNTVKKSPAASTNKKNTKKKEKSK
jgi:hypothetical protein